jgi:hypothetical protein
MILRADENARQENGSEFRVKPIGPDRKCVCSAAGPCLRYGTKRYWPRIRLYRPDNNPFPRSCRPDRAPLQALCPDACAQSCPPRDPACTARGRHSGHGRGGRYRTHACKALARAGYVPVTFDTPGTGWRQAVKYGPLVEGDLLVFRGRGDRGRRPGHGPPCAPSDRPAPRGGCSQAGHGQPARVQGNSSAKPHSVGGWRRKLPSSIQ